MRDSTHDIQIQKHRPNHSTAKYITVQQQINNVSSEICDNVGIYVWSRDVYSEAVVSAFYPHSV